MLVVGVVVVVLLATLPEMKIGTESVNGTSRFCVRSVLCEADLGPGEAECVWIPTIYARQLRERVI